MAHTRPRILSSSPGFSLTELLVVLAMIALLIGILLPALGTARRHAKTVECATRMRQLVIAVEIYADENDGYYPPRNGGDPSILTSLGPAVMAMSRELSAGGQDLPPLQTDRPAVWPIAVANNLRQIGVTVTDYSREEVGFLPGYVCPSDPQPTPPMSATERFIPWYSSFVFNGFNDYRHERQDSWSLYDTTAMRRDNISLPSRMANFGEKKSGPQFARLHVDIFAPPPYDPGTILDLARHRGLSNVAFADGSTRTFAPSNTLSPENLWAVRQANRLPRP